jgi:hypothetical protein
MPWIDVGRHTFDLDEVELITRGVRVEGNPDEPALTVTLKSGVKVDLLGRDAADFALAFAEFRASRTINRSPPDRPPEATPLVIVGEVESDLGPIDPGPTPPGPFHESNNNELRESSLSRGP